MNRRLFITRALMGLATVPLLGRLVAALPKSKSYSELVLSRKPILFFTAESFDEANGIWRDLSGNENHYWQGKLAEPPLVFDRVLTEEEIVAIYDYYSRKYDIPVQDVRITKLS